MVVDPAPPRARIPAGVKLLVLDDPSGRAAMPWLRAARRAGVAVASMHDVGIAPLPSDLAVDGSLGAHRTPGLGRDGAACRVGAAYAVLAAEVARAARRPRSAARSAVIIGLGGGRQAVAGLAVAVELRRCLDTLPALRRVQVLLSLGLVEPASGSAERRLAGVKLLDPHRFRHHLGRSAVAIVAGGTTLYEACALGTPAVAVPVVPAQATTIRRFARAGLAVMPVRDASGVGTTRWAGTVAAAAVALLSDAARREALARRARRAIDGQGSTRVARDMTAMLTTRRTR
jgi:spore coat polysaccharide biosynthesis predicted glycosyltransferase SpsG